MTNLTIDWSAVTQDFLGHELDTVNDLDTVALLMWALPLSELESKLNDDTLYQTDLITPLRRQLPPPDGNTMGKTSAQVYDFKVNGYAVTPRDVQHVPRPVGVSAASTYSYMAAVATGNSWGKGSACCRRSSSIPARRRRRSR